MTSRHTATSKLASANGISVIDPCHDLADAALARDTHGVGRDLDAASPRRSARARACCARSRSPRRGCARPRASPSAEITRCNHPAAAAVPPVAVLRAVRLELVRLLHVGSTLSRKLGTCDEELRAFGSFDAVDGRIRGRHGGPLGGQRAAERERFLGAHGGVEPRLLRVAVGEHHGHAPVHGACDGVRARVAREQRDAAQPRVVGGLRGRPERGEREQRAVVDAEVEGLARLARLLRLQPLVPAVGDLQRAPLRAREQPAEGGVAWRRSPCER